MKRIENDCMSIVDALWQLYQLSSRAVFNYL